MDMTGFSEFHRVRQQVSNNLLQPTRIAQQVNILAGRVNVQRQPFFIRSPGHSQGAVFNKRRQRKGMWLDEGRTLPADVRIESSTGSGTWLRFVLREGKNRQIRRMIETFKHTIHKLIRIRVGPILLGTLKVGKWRKLNAQELDALVAGSNEAVYHSDAPRPAEVKKKPKYKKGCKNPPPSDTPAQRRPTMPPQTPLPPTN